MGRLSQMGRSPQNARLSSGSVAVARRLSVGVQSPPQDLVQHRFRKRQSRRKAEHASNLPGKPLRLFEKLTRNPVLDQDRALTSSMIE